MSKDQGQTIRTVGELKQRLSSISDDLKIGGKDATNDAGVNISEDDGRVVMSTGGAGVTQT